MALRVPAALNSDGRLIAVHTATKSDGNFYCPACNRPVFIREGSKTKHFYHRRDECGWGYETALHLWAKEILAEARYVVLPTLNYSDSLKWEISNVELEKKMGDIRPDVVITTAKGKYAIEIAVTHFCDSAKIQKLNSVYDGAIEIDLKRCSRLITKEDLSEILLGDIDCKEWLINEREYADVKKVQNEDSWVGWLIGIGFVGICYVLQKIEKSSRRKRKNKNSLKKPYQHRVR